MVKYLKRLKSSKFVRVKAFPMYGGIGVSAPSLHRESTDSLIQQLPHKDIKKKHAVVQSHVVHVYKAGEKNNACVDSNSHHGLAR